MKKTGNGRKERLATDGTQIKHGCRKRTIYKEAMKTGTEGENTLNRSEQSQPRKLSGQAGAWNQYGKWSAGVLEDWWRRRQESARTQCMPYRVRRKAWAADFSHLFPRFPGFSHLFPHRFFSARKLEAER